RAQAESAEAWVGTGSRFISGAGQGSVAAQVGLSGPETCAGVYRITEAVHDDPNGCTVKFTAKGSDVQKLIEVVMVPEIVRDQLCEPSCHTQSSHG
ncbi:hypothetical protein P7K49_004443, partial [Saguinus oedipus]